MALNCALKNGEKIHYMYLNTIKKLVKLKMKDEKKINYGNSVENHLM